jgi:hypothetical protein
MLNPLGPLCAEDHNVGSRQKILQVGVSKLVVGDVFGSTLAEWREFDIPPHIRSVNPA